MSVGHSFIAAFPSAMPPATSEAFTTTGGVLDIRV